MCSEQQRILDSSRADLCSSAAEAARKDSGVLGHLRRAERCRHWVMVVGEGPDHDHAIVGCVDDVAVQDVKLECSGWVHWGHQAQKPL